MIMGFGWIFLFPDALPIPLPQEVTIMGGQWALSGIEIDISWILRNFAAS